MMLKLTRPDGSSIWLGGGYVITPDPIGPAGPVEGANARVTHAGVTQYVAEHPVEVVRQIEAGGSTRQALSGLVGLTQLLLARDDLPAGVREALTTNHRVLDAWAALGGKTEDDA